MDIKYIHDINKNYMVVNGEDTFVESFKIKMLQENNIEGLLNVKQKYLDSKERLYYDISSKQSMEVLFEKSHIQISELKQVIYELEICIESLKKYLLDFNDIVLNPKMVFIDIRTLKFSFCYYPYHKGEFRNELAEYLNFVITKIDHSDINALNLAYELQKITRKDNYVIKDLTHLINEPEIVVQEEVIVNQEPVQEISYEIPYINKKIKLTDKIIEKATIVILVVGLLLWAYIFSKTKDQNLKKVILIIIPAIGVYIGYIFLKNKKSSKKPEVKEIKVIVDEIEEDESMEDCLTVYLGASDSSTNRYLKCLSDVDLDFKIENYPVIIGKMDKNVDFVIKDSKVSRMHAKVYFENQKYLIEDLNSTNGTFLNGERLTQYEKYELSPGDLVKFSEITFKFV